MRVFTGQFDRTIDAKNRIQLPSQLRSALATDSESETAGLYVTLGQYRGTLSMFTEQGFGDLAERLETEFESSDDSRRFELQFYALASFVDIDKQGRLVLPDRLVKMAKLDEEVFVVGQKNRIDVWNRKALGQAMELDWAGDQWPDWVSFLRRRPRNGTPDKDVG
jgi:MraZ protein